MPKRPRYGPGPKLIAGGLLALLFAVPASVLAPKAAWDAADARCDDSQPPDAWGYAIEWKWDELGWVCTYKGRDYAPSGDKLRVGLTDLHG